jgi:hypothetical protein
MILVAVSPDGSNAFSAKYKINQEEGGGHSLLTLVLFVPN